MSIEHVRADQESAPWVVEAIRVLEAERDALAAHLARLESAIDQCYGDATRMHLVVGDIRDQTPQTSLARLKAQWEDGAVECMLAAVGKTSGKAECVRKSVCRRLYRAGYRKVEKSS